MGLDALDRNYLRALIENYGGGPAGAETLSHAIAEARDAVEDVIEPFLLQQGFIQRTPRGRVACGKAYEHLGLAAAGRGRADGTVRGMRAEPAPTAPSSDGAFVFPLRVYYEDTDFSGFVYHASYLRYLRAGAVGVPAAARDLPQRACGPARAPRLRGAPHGHRFQNRPPGLRMRCVVRTAYDRLMAAHMRIARQWSAAAN